MPSRVRCFLLTPTEHVSITLRRYAYNDQKTPDVPKCGRREPRYPGAEVVTYETHDVEVEIAREVGTLEPTLDGDHMLQLLPHTDPRWPAICACGYLFRDTDHRQVSRTRLYQRNDTGAMTTIGDAPAGALYDARHYDLAEYHRNGAELSLVCKTPYGEWYIDGPSSNGGGWHRTGTPPDISVTPSIGIGNPMRMHGFLTNGWLEIDQP